MYKFFITINKFELISEPIKLKNEEIFLRYKHPISGISLPWLAKATECKNRPFNDRQNLQFYS